MVWAVAANGSVGSRSAGGGEIGERTKRGKLTLSRRLTIPSDMSAPVPKSAVSFTPRDLNRQPAKVWAAVRKFGSVEVRARGGDVFILTRKKEKPKRVKLPDFEARWKRLRELGCVPPPASENERINRIIASEE